MSPSSRLFFFRFEKREGRGREGKGGRPPGRGFPQRSRDPEKFSRDFSRENFRGRGEGLQRGAGRGVRRPGGGLAWGGMAGAGAGWDGARARLPSPAPSPPSPPPPHPAAAPFATPLSAFRRPARPPAPSAPSRWGGGPPPRCVVPPDHPRQERWAGDAPAPPPVRPVRLRVRRVRAQRARDSSDL